MEAEIKTEDVTIDNWELFSEPKCKKEPITDLVPILPGCLKTEPQVKTEPEGPPENSAGDDVPVDDAFHRGGNTNSSPPPRAAAAVKSVIEVVLTDSDDEDMREAVTDYTSDDNFLDTRDAEAATAEGCAGASTPTTSDGRVGEATSGGRDVEDSRDAVCPRESVGRREVPSSDITPASGGNTEDEPKCLGPLYRPTECPVCSEEIRDRHAADTHQCFYSTLEAIYVATGLSPSSGLKCTLCDAPASFAASSFMKHFRGHFINVYYSCSICGKKLRSKETFVSHSYTHSGRWPHRCKVCGSGFVSQTALEKHEARHSDEISAVCEICGVGFKTKHSLARHRELHEGKLYPCTICNKVSKTSSALKNHLERHKATEERKKYKCDLCEKVYTTSTALKLHKDKSHFHKKIPNRYSCKICNKSANCRTKLETHMKSHTGEKSYTCDICKKKLSTKMALARHIAEHSGEKNYSCDICGMKFTQRSSVKRHKGTAHS